MKPRRHLVKNALGHYYVRIYVPGDLQPLLRKKELRRSLQMTCEATAITKSAEKIYVIKKYFQLLREQCGMPIRQDEWSLASQMIQVNGYSKESADEKIAIESFKIDGTLDDRKTLALMIGGDEAKKLLEEAENDERSKKLVAHMQTASAIRSENFIKKQANIPLLSDYLRFYLERKEDTGKVFKGSTLRKYQNAVGLFVDIFGDKPVSRYTERDAHSYRHALRLLPPKFRLNEPWRNMTIDQIVESDLVEETLATSTISGYLQCMNSIFSDLDKRRTLIDFNIFKDIKVMVTIDSRTKIFMERLYPLHHRHALMSGKPGAAIVTCAIPLGHEGMPSACENGISAIQNYMLEEGMNFIGGISILGNVPCVACKDQCGVSTLKMLFGQDATPENVKINSIENNSQETTALEKLGTDIVDAYYH